MLQQAAAEISRGVLATSAMNISISEQHNMDGAAADVVVARAFIHVAAALSAAAYGVNERATGARVQRSLIKLTQETTPDD